MTQETHSLCNCQFAGGEIFQRLVDEDDSDFEYIFYEIHRGCIQLFAHLNISVRYDYK